MYEKSHLPESRCDRTKFKVLKKSRVTKFKELLATAKDEPIEAKPDIARTVIAGAEPKAVNMSNAEQAEVAIRASDRLHRNNKPFILRLARVLQT